MHDSGFDKPRNRSYRELIEVFLSNSLRVPKNARWALRTIEENSQKILFTRAMLKLAAKLSEDQGLHPSDDNASDFLEKAHIIASNITDSFGAYHTSESLAEFSDNEAIKYFRMTCELNPQSLLKEASENGRMNVRIDDLECGIREYLESEFRSAYVDRILLACLTEAEIVKYINYVLSPNFFTKKSIFQNYQKSVFGTWFTNSLIALSGSGIGIALVLAASNYIDLFPEMLGSVLINIMIIGFCFFTVSSAIVTYLNRAQIRKPGEMMENTISAMSNFYAEFHDSTLISVPHFRNRVDELKKEGVVWPQPMWTILDDLNKREILFI
ncbi:hypothetical protein ROE7235_01381 [Roseibaca ekhonensis]|jgi:hypothetical protein|uniref:Uncharacterized protein n=2 Tax=Roseinatronobacter ekhonensis TaxID=254356 RepID=A0A3B0M6F6_9RHOB|nr:hypothetical protein ROE7235_01381 [Roseibaca ekhonensis]